ncbi:uncharacterized protein LOC114540130 [Dendronephthya gigantea]|uniref:uncharacterized protein LOC114540130 n=1 Tax=Dendronephthya gigantea TaxID=151771 RepID=UPI00106D29A9|nr:uncharacterized protein LOC114540130 [Dendronephthya gigantea]
MAAGYLDDEELEMFISLDDTDLATNDTNSSFPVGNTVNFNVKELIAVLERVSSCFLYSSQSAGYQDKFVNMVPFYGCRIPEKIVKKVQNIMQPFARGIDVNEQGSYFLNFPALGAMASLARSTLP